jgi:hypothetical protein
MYTTNNNAPHSPSNPPYIAAPPPPPNFAEPSHAAAEALPSFVTPAIDPRLRNAGIAILVSALVLLIGALTKSWFVAGGKEGGLGLLGIEACRRGVCQSVSWFDVPRVPSEIPIFATTALLACAATVVMMIHTGAMLLQGRPEAVRLRYLAPALGCAVLGTAAFVSTLAFGDATRGITLGWSTVVTFAGLLATGITALVMIRPLTQTGV